MKDNKILHKTVKGLLKRGYFPNPDLIREIQSTIKNDNTFNKHHPYYILSLVCDYGFYIGITREENSDENKIRQCN